MFCFSMFSLAPVLYRLKKKFSNVVDFLFFIFFNSHTQKKIEYTYKLSSSHIVTCRENFN